MRRKKKVYSWEPNLNTVKCDQVGCKLKGEYKAPKTPNSKEMYNFCLKHVKIYNKRWDYFAGKSQGDIYEFLKNENYNSNLRPIKERVSSRIKFDFDFDFDEDKFSGKNTDREHHIYQNDKEIANALEIFDLELPIKASSLKKRYNALVKQNHPDIHGQNKEKEKLLKKINNCYKILKKIAR